MGGKQQRLAPPLIDQHGAAALAPRASFAACSARLWRQLDATVPSPVTAPVHLVGYSLGARVALSMALQSPHRVASLVLIGVHPGLRADADRAERRLSDCRWARRLQTEALPEVLRAWDAQPLFAHRAHLHAEARAALTHARQGLDARALALSLEQLGLAEMPDTRPLLSTLDLPVHLVVGTDDAKFLRLAHEMLPLLPQGTLCPIKGAGHDVVLTHPQAVAQVCLAAFARGSGRP